MGCGLASVGRMRQYGLWVKCGVWAMVPVWFRYGVFMGWSMVVVWLLYGSCMVVGMGCMVYGE